MGDPQSLNLYAYVRNNPITHVDADGHCDGWCDIGSPKTEAEQKLLANEAVSRMAYRVADMLHNRKIQVKLYELFEQAGFGRAEADHTEHSSWIVSGSNQFDVVVWPYSAERNEADWKGPAPEGTEADAHSHPDDRSEKPSVADHNLASGLTKDGKRSNRTFRGPVIVLSRKGIWLALPNQETPLQLYGGLGWTEEFKPTPEEEKK
jgi:hypothetical protein